MSGSSLDGLDIAYAHFQETAGKWTYEILHADCYAYDAGWKKKLEQATGLPALGYQLLHTEYGNFIGTQVSRFIEEKNLHYQVQLISSHGHTTFHLPLKKMTAQLGDGAAIAAATGINVISDLRAMDMALGGQGAPIVPIGEKLLLGDYDFFLNLGGIANISSHHIIPSTSVAFDICPANRVLNMLVNDMGRQFDKDGEIARSGSVNHGLLEKLNQFEFYTLPYPKSLANDFGTDAIYPMIKKSGCPIPDAARTYVEHICIQIKNAVALLLSKANKTDAIKLLATGGGAHNIFLIERLKDVLADLKVAIVVPDDNLIDYKEALIIGFIGTLRWREENNVLSSVTGAVRDSVGGAVWIG